MDGGSPRGPAAAPALARCTLCPDSPEFICDEALFSHLWNEHLSKRTGKSELIYAVLERAFEKMRKAGVAP